MSNIVKKTDNSKLALIDFTSLRFWDYDSLLNKSRIESNYPIVELSQVLKQRKEAIVVEEDSEYRRCRVRLYGKGIVLRDVIQGRSIKTKKQFLCKENDLVVAEIDAKFGGFGIVPVDLHDAIVSSHYFVFEIDVDKILVEYLELLLKCKRFMNQVKATGSTNYAAIRPYHVLDYVIPLPDLRTQKELVEKYNSIVQQVRNNKLRIGIIKEKRDRYLDNALSLKSIDSRLNSSSKLYSVNFTDIRRWDVWREKKVSRSEAYPNLTLADIVTDKPFYGANVKGVKWDSKTRYIRITDINEDGSLNQDYVSPEIIDEKYLLADDDFLIARSGNTVGKSFLYDKKYGRCIYAGYLIKFTLNTSVVVPKYVLHFTKSKVFKMWIEANKRVSGQPNINGQEYLDSPIVVPPKEIQNEIVKIMEKWREETTQLSDENIRLLNMALADFEGEIFNETENTKC